MARLYKNTKLNTMRFLSYLISTVLSTLFGCNIGPSSTLAGYGMPHANFKISGTVKSALSSEPVNGISVLIYENNDTLHVKDSTLTDSYGYYSFDFSDFPTSEYKWKLCAKDIDGIENGIFSQKDTSVTIFSSELSGGDGSWNEGSAEKTIDLDLEDNS